MVWFIDIKLSDSMVLSALYYKWATLHAETHLLASQLVLEHFLIMVLYTYIQANIYILQLQVRDGDCIAIISSQLLQRHKKLCTSMVGCMC